MFFFKKMINEQMEYKMMAETAANTVVSRIPFSIFFAGPTTDNKISLKKEKCSNIL